MTRKLIPPGGTEVLLGAGWASATGIAPKERTKTTAIQLVKDVSEQQGLYAHLTANTLTCEFAMWFLIFAIHYLLFRKCRCAKYIYVYSFNSDGVVSFSPAKILSVYDSS